VTIDRDLGRRWVAGAALAGAAACSAPPSASPTPTRAPTVTWGFTAPWDPKSDSSVRENSARLDAVVSGWIQLDSITGMPHVQFTDRANIAPGTSRFALVSSYGGGRFRADVVRRIAAEDLALSDAADALARIVAAGSYTGLVFDFEEQRRADTALVLHAIRTLGDAARLRGARTIAVAIPAGDTTAYPTRAFADVADALVVMLYDEHWSTSGPGPIASPQWVSRTLGRRVGDVGPDRLIAALPLYGYRWGANPTADALSYSAAQRAVADAGVEILRDPVSRSLHAALPGQWNLWLSDAELIRTLRAEVLSLGVTHFALWRLGQEDPAVWSVIGRD
jgi:peptidoglycan-N-acetylglucosamine deacetylase